MKQFRLSIQHPYDNRLFNLKISRLSSMLNVNRILSLIKTKLVMKFKFYLRFNISHLPNIVVWFFWESVQGLYIYISKLCKLYCLPLYANICNALNLILHRSTISLSYALSTMYVKIRRYVIRETLFLQQHQQYT